MVFLENCLFLLTESRVNFTPSLTVMKPFLHISSIPYQLMGVMSVTIECEGRSFSQKITFAYPIKI